MSRGPFSLQRDGSVEARLTATEADALRDLADEMVRTLEADDEPSLGRLFPSASRDDAQLAEDFRKMTHDDLRGNKIASARTIAETIERGARKRDSWRATLSADDARAWLTAINDARLVLGTKLDVTENMDHRPKPATDPEANVHNMYLYLSALEERLVEELLRGVPVAGID